jgi:carboxylesterase type B
MEKLSGTGTDNYNNKAEFDWRPVVDNYASNPFLPLDPLEAMQTGVYNHIPFMSGTVKNDGAIFVSILKGKGSSPKQVQENWGSIGPKIISGLPTMNATAEDFFFANITMNYYNHPAGESVLELDQPLMDLTSDIVFLSPDQKTIQLMSKHSQHVFNYYLTQKTDKSPIGQLLQLGTEYTPIHGDDLIFLMTNYGQKLELSEEESALSNHMIKYWTNFAKFGHPTPSSEDLPFWASVTETAKVCKMYYNKSIVISFFSRTTWNSKLCLKWAKIFVLRECTIGKKCFGHLSKKPLREKLCTKKQHSSCSTKMNRKDFKKCYKGERVLFLSKY